MSHHDHPAPTKRSCHGASTPAADAGAGPPDHLLASAFDLDAPPESLDADVVEADDAPARSSEPTSAPARVADVLVDNHRQFLRFLERRLGDPALAEDVLQAAFVRGLERAGQLRDDESVVAWFYRVLRNAIVDHHRRTGRTDRRLDAVARELAAAADPLPDDRNAICGCVTRLVDTLKPEYAAAIRRVELDGLAVKDFADETHVTANNAAVRLYRARKALREQVRRSCGTCAEHGCIDCRCSAS
jgi:RNA polymerase sigma factor (sigma-70 family)